MSDNVFDDLKKKQFDNSTLISVIFLILFVSLFNRIGEYGTDITGQLLAGVLIYISIKLILRDSVNKEYLLIFISLLTYLITIKTYFLVYIFFPIVLLTYNKKISRLEIYRIFNIIFVLMSLDEEILQVLGNLEDYSDSHPVLYSLWKKFIHNKYIAQDIEHVSKKIPAWTLIQNKEIKISSSEIRNQRNKLRGKY